MDYAYDAGQDIGLTSIAVPEPSTLVLMGLGGVAAGGRRLKKAALTRISPVDAAQSAARPVRTRVDQRRPQSVLDKSRFNVRREKAIARGEGPQRNPSRRAETLAVPAKQLLTAVCRDLAVLTQFQRRAACNDRRGPNSAIHQEQFNKFDCILRGASPHASRMD